ncbi:hypothetical protein [Prevotella sp. KH2C16]|uniref:hypothetical protein n=1 Tax=Prevotella sp. KH2C16 TaxID=1855325 RepID=UPI0008E37DD4|nr:hypothetical protein [Prevotella sp. KH2C16]SFF99192.1 hypothetical protein SAMN05216383_103142 [Prevotella sp. KH2C16]
MMKQLLFAVLSAIILTGCSGNDHSEFMEFFQGIKRLDYSPFKEILVSPRGEGEMVLLKGHPHPYQVLWNDTTNRVDSISNFIKSDTTEVVLTKDERNRIAKCLAFYHRYLYDYVSIQMDSTGNITMGISKWPYRTYRLYRFTDTRLRKLSKQQIGQYTHLKDNWYYTTETADII